MSPECAFQDKVARDDWWDRTRRISPQARSTYSQIPDGSNRRYRFDCRSGTTSSDGDETTTDDDSSVESNRRSRRPRCNRRSETTSSDAVHAPTAGVGAIAGVGPFPKTPPTLQPQEWGQSQAWSHTRPPPQEVRRMEHVGEAQGRSEYLCPSVRVFYI